MRVVEEPFLSREAIVAVLRPGEPAGEAPFRTLRNHQAASAGLRITTRIGGGRLAGRLYLYSSLNGDAARSFRRGHRELSRELARCAEAMEQSPAATHIHSAVARLAAEMAPDPWSAEAPGDLRRYAGLRREVEWPGADSSALVRSWLVQSRAWLETAGSEHGQLIDSIETLRIESERARARILAEERRVTSTFYGVVARLDSSYAEVEAESGEKVLLARSELKREGLDSLGTAVALLQEEMPGGGTLSLPKPAALLEASAIPKMPSPYARRQTGEPEQLHQMSDRDFEWIQQSLERNPPVRVRGPLKLG